MFPKDERKITDEAELKRFYNILSLRMKAGKDDKRHSFKSPVAKDDYQRTAVNYYGATQTELNQVEMIMVADQQKVLNQESDMNERQNIKADLRQQKLNSLDQFANTSFENEEVQQQALKAGQAIKEASEKGKKTRTDKEVLRIQLTTMAKQAKQNYVEGLHKLIDSSSKWFNKYAQTFNDYQYQDPQQEALKRQDFDTMLAGLDDTGLANYIEYDMANANLSEYALNKLKAVTKTDKPDLYQRVSQYCIQNNIGKEYATTTEWQNVQKKLGKAQMLRKGHLVINGENAFSFDDLPEQLLEGYQVSDPTQRQAAGL